LERLALAVVAEQRAARRWKIFFRLAWLGVVLLLLAAMLGWIGRGGRKDSAALAEPRHTAVVEISGVIAPGGKASAEKLIAGLQHAFSDKATAGVILRINSPGGSPVQSGQVVDEIRRLRAKYPDTRLYAVIEDLAASGGYYIASAADEVVVDKASLVGSIGVIMEGFGVTGAMEKLGIDRRTLAAGDNKSFLDPFAPVNPAHVAHARTLLAGIHQQFIDTVRRGRGQRLKETPETFSGLIWTGAQSVELGLADRLGSVESVARELIKAEQLVDFTVDESYWEQVAKRFGVQLGEVVGEALVRAFTPIAPTVR
jgi:protease-4